MHAFLVSHILATRPVLYLTNLTTLGDLSPLLSNIKNVTTYSIRLRFEYLPENFVFRHVIPVHEATIHNNIKCLNVSCGQAN
jgi:hypothetical protein